MRFLVERGETLTLIESAIEPPGIVSVHPIRTRKGGP